MPRLPLSVDCSFDHGKDLRNMLHFIQRDRHVQASNEAVGVTFGSRQNARIIEGEILAVLFRQIRRLHQGAFPGLTCAID